MKESQDGRVHFGIFCLVSSEKVGLSRDCGAVEALRLESNADRNVTGILPNWGPNV